MDEGDEAKLTDWYDVLQEVANGRPDGHDCPFCGQGPLEVEVEGFRLRVDCKNCGEFFEGRRP